MTDRTFPVTLTVAEVEALDTALACVHATLAVVAQLRYGRPGELRQARDTLIALLDRIEQQAA